MKASRFCISLAIYGLLVACRADDITTLDGHKYENVKDVALKDTGLFSSMAPVIRCTA